ncbi:hypothetical protein SDC9_76712 [bioreactor metagenome]|uniref:Uncharacterized protein n=1 Tax=bioreactor metagenome TaxID=1076179 RepID=A0A644YPG6_9ZZZZ
MATGKGDPVGGDILVLVLYQNLLHLGRGTAKALRPARTGLHELLGELHVVGDVEDILAGIGCGRKNRIGGLGPCESDPPALLPDLHLGGVRHPFLLVWKEYRLVHYFVIPNILAFICSTVSSVRPALRTVDSTSSAAFLVAARIFSSRSMFTVAADSRSLIARLIL